MKIPTLLTFLCLTYFTGVAQSNDFSSIVRIVALNEYGENDIGTGILIGNDKTHLYITTANHVVKIAKDVKVFFHNQSTAQTATVIQKDEKMDVAVLKMKLPNRQPLPHLLAADPKILEVQKKVLSIGHPGGSFWKSNYQNIIQEISIYNQPEIMSITPQGIIPGCSGSIVLTYEGIWLGMITETTSVEAKCVKSDAITKKLKSWNIPINLTIPKEPATVKIKEGIYDKKNIANFSIGMFEVSYEDFRLFVAATGYVTDAEKEGFSWTFYNASEGEFIIEQSREVFKNTFESIQKGITSNFNYNTLNKTAPLNVMKDKLYDLFDYRDLNLRYYDPAEKFLYELFDENDYTISDRELENVLDKMQSRVRSEYRGYDPLEVAFSKIQSKIKNEFKFNSNSYELTDDLKNLEKLLHKSFDYNQLPLSQLDFASRITGSRETWEEKFKYLDRVNWRQDAVGRNRTTTTFDHPVIHISYVDAMAYCEWLSKLHHRTYRLPTTSEWEYAATSKGTLTTETIDKIHHQANLRDESFCKWTGWRNCNGNEDGYDTLAPVQAMQADDLGIFQIHGNVAEWCVDKEGYAVQAGSHYQSYVRQLWELSKKRNSNFRSAMVGFRVVKEE